MVLACGLVVLAGCASAPPAQLVSSADNGTTRDLAVGQQLQVTLDARPDSGYRWETVSEPGDALSAVGSPTYLPHSTQAGLGGSQVWVFRAQHPGTSILQLRYQRSFETTTPPLDTFALSVNIR
jgi:predicted secreted protein